MRLPETAVRRALVAVVLWCLVVTAGSGLVWTVISGAGQEFVAQPGGPAQTADPVDPSTPTSAGQPPTTPGAPVRSKTWSGSAGVVTTRCTDSRIELVRAVPSADGYVVEVKDGGPGQVDVEFEGRGDATVPETRVRARCVNGSPLYDARAED